MNSRKEPCPTIVKTNLILSKSIMMIDVDLAGMILIVKVTRLIRHKRSSFSFQSESEEIDAIVAFSQTNSDISVMRSPRSVGLDITSRCNLRCQYCYFFEDSAREYIELPTDDWLRFFHELGDCGAMDVTIAGREPFIRPDLRDLLDGIVENRMRFSILSNGGLINNDVAAFIANTKRCNHVQSSSFVRNVNICHTAPGTAPVSLIILSARSITRAPMRVFDVFSWMADACRLCLFRQSNNHNAEKSFEPN